MGLRTSFTVVTAAVQSSFTMKLYSVLGSTEVAVTATKICEQWRYRADPLRALVRSEARCTPSFEDTAQQNEMSDCDSSSVEYSE